MVIPTHNRCELLALTLRTALWQKDVDLEVIVVDDGSRDATPRFLRRLADDRVHVVRHDEPRGVSEARNSGIDSARGEWVAFLDDDDLWSPDKLVLQLRTAEASGSPWVYAGALKIDESQRIVGGEPPPHPEAVTARLPWENLVPGGCSGVIALRSEVASSGGFDPGLVSLADWDLWIRLGARARPARVSEPVVGYRFHMAQMSLDVDLILREVAVIERRYGRAVDRGALHHYLAHQSLRSGRRRKGLEHLWRAAAAGRLRPVVAHVNGVLWTKFISRLPGERKPRSDRHREWRAPAQAWLGAVREVGPRSSG